MSTIGQFKLKNDAYEGTISTLTMNCKPSFIPNNNKKHEDSPDYFVKSGECDLGFARHAVSKGDKGTPYLSVYLDDPSFRSPIWAALFETDGDANLVWSRSRKKAN